MSVLTTLLSGRTYYLKILAGILLVVVLAATAATIIVPHLLNLETYRPQILSAARQALHRPVSYERATFSWQLTPTVVIQGITIAEKSGTGALLKLDRLTFSLALLPLIHKELHLRKIVAERPIIILDRDRAGAFSIDDLFTGPPSGFKLSLDTLRIQNGLIRFTDRTVDPAGLTTSLEDLDLTVSGLNRGETSRFKLSARVPDGERQAMLALSGTVRIPAAGQPLDGTRLDLTLSAKDLNAGRYWPYYGSGLPFERLRGVLDIEQTFKGTALQFSTRGQATVRELRFNYPRAFTAPLTPRNVRLVYELERTPRDLTLKSIDLDVDSLRVKGSCTLGDLDSSDMHIKAQAATSPFRLEEFNRYIPYGIIPAGTGNFIRQHITGGLFRLDDGRLEGRLSQITHMEQGDNYNALFIRATVEKGLVNFGPQVPAFSSVKGGLEMRGKDFSLRGMTGRFGTSLFSLDGKIAGYPLKTPANYPFSMTITPSKTEVDWLLHQKDPTGVPFSGQSTLSLAGSGTASDYQLAGTWDLARAEYRYRKMLHKPTGTDNKIRFTVHLRSDQAELTEFSYQLAPLDVTASASYHFNGHTPLTFALSTSRFIMNRDLPFVPALQKYHPAGTLQARISGSGNPALPDGIRVNGDVTLTDVSLSPTSQIKPLNTINGQIHLTESAMETKRLTGRIGASPFTVSGRVSGRDKPAVELGFSAPLLHPEDFGFVSSGQIPELKNLAGAITLKGNRLTVTSLSGQTADTRFNASGEFLDSGTPSLDLRVDFPSLRVEDLLPLSNLKRAVNRPSQPGKIDLNARITSAAGSFRETPFQQLDTQLTLNNDLLAVQSLGIGLFGGTVSGKGQADLSARGGPAFQASYRLEHVPADKLLHLAGAKPYLSGNLSAVGEATARGKTLPELAKSAQTHARIHLQQGSVSLPASGDGTAAQIPYTELEANLTLKEQLLTIQGLKAGVFGGSAAGNGQVDFAAAGGPAYQAGYRLERIAADQLLRAAGAKPYLNGHLSAEGVVTARGNSSDDLKSSVLMTANLLLTDGVLNNPAIFGSKATNAFPFKKFQTHLTLNAGKLDLGSVLMDVFSGVVSGNVGADFSAPDGPAYRVNCRLTDVDAAALFRAFDVTKELTGQMNMQAELTARGEGAEALRKTARGTLSTHMKKGVIKKYGFVSKVFSILNVSQIVDFRVSDLTSFGMPYDDIDGSFQFENGIVTTSDLSIQSPSLNMTIVGDVDLVKRQIDVKIGVQPFQSFGRLISRIPVIGWILTGGKKRVVVVYYEAKGPFGDPTITGTSMASLPGGVYNIFKRAFNLPEELISQPGSVIMGN